MSGLGCGHRLAPVLAQLDKVQGIARTYANHSGDMLRVSVDLAAEPDEVAVQVIRLLDEDQVKPTRVTGEDFDQALASNQWRQKELIDELSSIEFRTLGLRRIESFVKDERLDDETKQGLLRIVEDEWDRLTIEITGRKSKSSAVTDWDAQCRRCAEAVVQRARRLLTADQATRLAQSLER